MTPTNEMLLERPVMTESAAHMLGITTKTLHAWRGQGRGPKYHKVGRRVVYRRQDVEAYLAGCAREAK